MNTATDSLQSKTPKTGGGYTVGQSATDLVGFYGTTPAVQPAAAAQSAVTALTDSSGGTASATTGMQALTSTYNSTLIANSLSTLSARVSALIALANQTRSDLVTIGIQKGSA